MDACAIGLPVVLAGQIGDDGRQWVEVMPTATDARNGRYRFTVTRDDLEIYAQSIRENAGMIPIDYDHEGARDDGSTKAAGWYTGEARVTDDPKRGPILEAQVQWTPSGADAIRNGEYKRTSPEFSFHDRDAKTGLMSRAKAIVAATLTNRPFFKELAPLGADLDDDAITALAEHFGEDPMEIFTVLAAGMEPYGDVTYADPGYQDDKKKRYPLDTEEHIRAAWSYINKQGNGGKYTPAQLSAIKAKIRAAMKRVGADVTATTEGATMAHELKAVAAALGLDPETATDETVTAALKTRDDELAAAKTELASLKATAASGDERIKKLEDERRAEKIESALAKAVTDNQIDPAQKPVLAEQFAENFDGLVKLLETFPARARKAAGAGGAGDDNADLPADAAALATEYEQKTGDRVISATATELEIEAATRKALADKGKHEPTGDEYIAEYERQTRLVAA